MAIQPDALRQILMREFGYKTTQVNKIVEKILGMDPPILAAFEKWLAVREFPAEPVYNNVSPALLSQVYPLKPPAIFMLLDWIRRDPKTALQAMLHEYGTLPPGKPEPPEGIAA